MQHTIRLPTQPSDDGWDRLFGEAVYGVGGDVGVGGEAQVQFAAGALAASDTRRSA